jgi:hypothetical protein
MSLEFVIIPSKQSYEDHADDVKAMMRHNIKQSMIIDFDKSYDDSLNSRINKWRRKEYDIIIVDEEYPDTNCIKVKFNDKGTRIETMTLLNFIDLVSSFENNEEQEQEEEEEEEEEQEEANQNGGCSFM